MRRSGCAGALIAALALAATGCGGDSDSDKVKDTVKTFFTALADRDAKKLCGILSRPLVQATQVSGGNCAKNIAAVAAQAVPENKRKEAKQISVIDVKIRGTTATAVAKSKRAKRTMSLVKEDGKWKLATT